MISDGARVPGELFLTTHSCFSYRYRFPARHAPAAVTNLCDLSLPGRRTYGRVRNFRAENPEVFPSCLELDFRPGIDLRIEKDSVPQADTS